MSLCIDKFGKEHHRNHLIFSKHTGTPLHNIIGSSFHPRCKRFELFEVIYLGLSNCISSSNELIRRPKLHLPEYFVTVDHKMKSIILTIRGSLGLSDIVTALSCAVKSSIIYL